MFSSLPQLKLQMFLPLITASCILLASCRPTHYQYKAQSDVQMLANACKGFYLEFGYYPVPTNRLDDVQVRALLSVLLAMPESEDAKRLNSRGIRFLNISPSQLKNGLFEDPWGSPYHFVLTTNNSQRISIGRQIVDDNVAVWSNGPNKKNEMGQGDDICSWKNLTSTHFAW